MMLTVNLVVACSIRNKVLFFAFSVMIAQNVSHSSMMTGTVVMRWAREKPGLKAALHFFQVAPSLVTRLLQDFSDERAHAMQYRLCHSPRSSKVAHEPISKRMLTVRGLDDDFVVDVHIREYHHTWTEWPAVDVEEVSQSIVFFQRLHCGLRSGIDGLCCEDLGHGEQCAK